MRPVLVIQTDLLNDAGHPSTWVLPCTTRLTGQNLLRVVLPRGVAGNSLARWGRLRICGEPCRFGRGRRSPRGGR
ncbi:MAG: hypothetical protein DMF80_17875 [Acidobacteria bacterium]|nr:MAG: hypothetical protein DMF80_17875 [Acidobacteriota bacterium]